jgi:hypothetical protein
MKIRSFLNDNWDMITVLVVYSILAVFSLKYFQYKFGADEISYVNIAHAYVTGQWGSAINGYWSPLYSWLMTPFLLFGSTPLYDVYVSKIVSLIIGFFTFISVRNLSRTFRMDRMVERSILISLIPVILYFSLILNTPDLLLVCVLIYYLSIIFNAEYSNSLINGVLCGFIGAVAYLTKSFAFPFFVVTFLLFNLRFHFKGLKIEKRKVLKNLVLGFLVFFVVSGLWVGTISEKYGKLTISTAGEYNQAQIGPEYGVNTMEYGLAPIYYLGLIKPSNNNAISIWDDLSYIKMKQWSPFSSLKNFEYELKIIRENSFYTVNIIESFMPVAVILLVSMVLFILRFKVDMVSKNILKYLLFTMLIYIGGYCLIIPEWRYLWFIFVLLIFSGFLMVDRLYKSHVLTLNIRNILLFLLISSFVIQPAYEVVLFASPDDEVYNLSNILKADYGVHGNIASNDEWGEMLTFSYYLNGKYYGISKKTNSSIVLNQELEDNNIDYYFVWGTTDLKLSGYHEITNGKIEGLRIYSRN